MHRRQFLTSAAASSLLLPNLSSLLRAQERDRITVSGTGVKFTPSAGGKPWSIEAEALKINGLTLPRFEAGWVAAHLASGVLSSVGGFLFDALISALGLGGPRLEELLHRQLEQIEKIVKTEIRNNEIRRNIARLKSIRIKMREYMAAPASIDRLNDATADSLNVITDLQSFGFETYLIVLSAGSLRLAILQERVKRDAREKENYRQFVKYLETYHKEIRKHVTQQTDVNWLADQNIPDEERQLTEKLPFPANFAMHQGRMVIERVILTIEERHLGYEVREIPKLQLNDPRVEELVVADYNAEMKRRYGGNTDDIYDPKQPFRGLSNPTLYGMIRHRIHTILEEPQEKIHQSYIDWDVFRRQVSEKTIFIGDQIVKDWNASLSDQLRGLRSPSIHLTPPLGESVYLRPG